MDTEGDKDDLISRIAATKRKAEEDDEDDEEERGKRGGKGKNMKKLMDSSSSSSSSTSSSSSAIVDKKDNQSIMIRNKNKITCDSLPSNMHSLSAPQLRSVCAANGLLHLLPKNASKSEILHILESEVYDDGKREKIVESESDDDASVASDDGGSDIEILK